MSRKIHELQAALGSGARTNKYRVLFPYLGQELDIQCHDVQSPGRSLGTVDVYLKGREFKMAGDRADQGSIALTFYNDPYFFLRRFFLKVIGGIQNYHTPQSIENSLFELSGISNDLNDMYSQSLKIGENGSATPSLFGEIGSFLGKTTDVVLAINSAYNQMKYNITSISNNITSLQNGGLAALETNMPITPVSYGFYVGKPWYMTDMIIQQLGPDEEVLSEMVLHNAFISEVGNVDYTDENGEISQTSLTVTYSGVSYGNDQEIRFLERY